MKHIKELPDNIQSDGQRIYNGVDRLPIAPNIELNLASEYGFESVSDFAQTVQEYRDNKYIPVLDHGFVRYVDHMGSDQTILAGARVSYRSKGKGEEADKKLLAYLYKNKHLSPFELPKIQFNIKMPIFVMRQYIRHRMQNVNEVSARYTELPDQFYIPETWREQDAKNKQGSSSNGLFNPNIAFQDHNDASFNGLLNNDASNAILKHNSNSYSLYQGMIKAGIAREMARMVLPVNIYTEIICCWDIRNLLAFTTLRDDAHAQSEIQEYGRAMKKIAAQHFPWVFEIYEKYKFVVQEVE